MKSNSDSLNKSVDKSFYDSRGFFAVIGSRGTKQAPHNRAKKSRARNVATADPHLRRAAQAARRLSPVTPTHVRSSSDARGPTTPGRRRAASSTPPSAFTAMSLPPGGTKSRGVSMPTLKTSLSHRRSFLTPHLTEKRLMECLVTGRVVRLNL